jgi:ribonuclease H / adenosylcobalamin/alpha-ribazole phosphatase
VVLESPDGEVIAEVARGIGWTTNNVAEYEGLIEGLRLARQKGVRNLEVFMDSTLVTQQMKGVFKVKHSGLKPLHEVARALAGEFESIRFQAIPREHNRHADKLSNEGMDRWMAENPEFEPPEPEPETLF